MTRTISYGICSLCGKRTSKAAMARHLKNCSPDHDSSRGTPAHLFHLRAEDAYSPIFWLDLEMKASSTLADLDAFLRETWLECCGHLSAFDIEGTTYSVHHDFDPLMYGSSDRGMNVELEEAPDVATRFHHTYDFGTSTELMLRVMGEREGLIGRTPLRVLSRNEAPVWTCAICEQRATQICTYCMYEREDPFYCDDHSEDHDCEEEMLLPVVNSPRMGLCGYTGPLRYSR